jgi:phosphomannomutase/phosphoglucomutase
MRIPDFLGNEIIKTDSKDGLKIYLDRGWILFRPSGTEPVFRVYVESDSPENAQSLLSLGKDLLYRSMYEKS